MRERSAHWSPPEHTSLLTTLLGAERAILLTIALSTMLAPLNSTMIAVALPDIMRAFRADLHAAGWLVTSYLVTMAAVLPVAGKLGDRFGRRPLVLGGLIYFGFASVGAALAPNLPVLLLFRFQQAVAGAIALPNGSALVREVIPEHRRASSYGMIGAMVSVAAAAGPPLGGLLSGTAGWQAIFWVNIPMVVAALIIGWYALPSAPPRAAGRPFDVLGSVLLLASLAGFSLLLRQIGTALAPLILGGAALLLVAGLLARLELRVPDPILHPEFFRSLPFAAASGAVALSNLAMYSTLLALPVILAARQGWTSVRVGLALTALSGTTVIFGPIGGRLADRYGRRAPVIAGLATLSVGLLPLAVTGGNAAVPLLLVALAVAGVGLGISSAGMQAAAVESVEARHAGAASGIFSTSRYIGSIAGTSVLPVLLGDGTSGSGGVFIMTMIAALLSIVAALGLPPQAKPAPTP